MVDSISGEACVTTMTYHAKLSGCEDLQYLDCSKFTHAKPSSFTRCALDIDIGLDKLRVKLFPKGSVHVTGCKSEQDAIAAVNKVIQALQQAYAISAEIQALDMVMINIRTLFEDPPQLDEIAKACESLGAAAEIPERPPSCLVRYQGATAMVYKSGKVILSAKSPESALSVYKVLERAIATIKPYKNTFSLQHEFTRNPGNVARKSLRCPSSDYGRLRSFV